MRVELPDAIRREVDDLTERFGAPLIRAVAVGTEAFWRRQTSNRTCEVCMVVRRPNGCLLTAAKTFYPAGAYRLLTGGVEHGERVLDALLREIYEETGLEVAVRRLLAVVVYHPEEIAEGSDRAARFYTFAFLLDEMGGTLGPTDPNERLAAYREIEPAELPAVADFLDRLPDAYDNTLTDNWCEWGRYRAVIHRVVWDAIAPLL